MGKIRLLNSLRGPPDVTHRQVGSLFLIFRTAATSFWRAGRSNNKLSTIKIGQVSTCSKMKPQNRRESPQEPTVVRFQGYEQLIANILGSIKVRNAEL